MNKTDIEPLLIKWTDSTGLSENYHRSCPSHSKLQKSAEDGSQTHRRNVGQVLDSSAGRSRAAVRAGARGSILGGGVGDIGFAREGALDDIVLAKALEVRAVKGALALHVETTLDLLQRRQFNPSRHCQRLSEDNPHIDMYLLVEVAAEVQSTSDGLELGNTGDLLELFILGDLETAVDGLEHGKRDVRQGIVVVEHQVAHRGQVGSGEILEVVAKQTKLTGQALQRWNRNAAGVAESHVAARLQVRQGDLELLRVGSEVQETGAVGNVVDIDLAQGRVRGDVKVTDSVEGDAIQRGQTSIGDGDTSSLGDTLGE